MDYIGNKCPVCEKYFHADDDIVVCPECGTPHHRECYEQTGHCCNEHLHAEGYDYNESGDTEKSKEKICPSCGKPNNENAFFCNYCGSSLTPQQDNRQTQQNPAGAQNGADQAGNPFAAFMDPMGGVPGDTDLGDGVTAGEAAKYVKQNTPYFVRVFNNIKSFNKSKFSFAAALFPGGYMLYRKMYKLGAMFTALHFALEIFEMYLYFYIVQSDILQNTNALLSSMFSLSESSVASLSILYVYEMVIGAILAMRIVIGFCFNRMYYKHCKKQILSIKQNPQDGENPETLLQTKGGVNMPLAISSYTAYMIILYLPSFISFFVK